MAKLKIYTFPDQVLAQKAQPIERVDRAWHQVADDMLETMYDAPGIGLAANQVGILKRILVIDTDYAYDDPEGAAADLQGGKPLPEGGEVIGGHIIANRKPRILINPKIIHKEGEIIYCEGCLSIPEYTAEVKRAEKIKVEYQDIDGLTKTLSADGLLAVCLQHEMDHLEGKLFIDRLSSLKKELAKKQLIKTRRKREQEEGGGALE